MSETCLKISPLAGQQHHHNNDTQHLCQSTDFFQFQWKLNFRILKSATWAQVSSDSPPSGRSRTGVSTTVCSTVDCFLRSPRWPGDGWWGASLLDLGNQVECSPLGGPDPRYPPVTALGHLENRQATEIWKDLGDKLLWKVYFHQQVPRHLWRQALTWRWDLKAYVVFSRICQNTINKKRLYHDVILPYFWNLDKFEFSIWQDLFE